MTLNCRYCGHQYQVESLRVWVACPGERKRVRVVEAYQDLGSQRDPVACYGFTGLNNVIIQVDSCLKCESKEEVGA